MAPPQTVDIASGLAPLHELPDRPAVFLAWAPQGAPYLARTTLLRRRLLRLFRPASGPSRLLNLTGIATRVEYWLTASRLEAAVVFYQLARRHYPETYLKLANLRLPSYVRLLLSKTFPRTVVSTHAGGAGSISFGPFRSRAAAEQFESAALDLFQVRRCQDDFTPSAGHPGCIYGEMGLCLRPCQLVVGIEEYRSETARLAAFLSTRGRSLADSTAAARDRLSEEMNFEEAARQHRRLEKIQEAQRLAGDLAADIDHLYGVAVTPSVEPEAVELWFLARGAWLEPRRFPLAAPGAEIVSLDRRLREIVESLAPPTITARERQEHLALLARWVHSTWRDGEWISCTDFGSLPYRRLVNAVHRVAAGPATPPR